MEYFKGLASYRGDGRTAITLGKFDGLHRGHQKLIHKVRQLKEAHEVKSVVFAFDMTPLFERLGLPRDGIMSNEERRMHLEDEVDALVECPFTEKISSMEAEVFIRDILSGLFHAKYVVVGTDFRFGHDKRGDVNMLAEYAGEYDYELFVIEKEMYGDREISSTYVREELRKGNMQVVNEMLGYPYTVAGIVEYGKQLGRRLGFPTLNVHPAKEKLLPPNGVYIDRVKLDDLLGYEKQKEALRRNTEAFLDGKRANNVLLYGDAGTGKSTSVKALINEYFDRGLRMIEIYKHQFRDLSAVMGAIKNRNYRFIIFIDDLSFEENEVEYKFLKAVIEGGVETRPDNVLIYATSNRRHLIRETWNDRTDMEHHGDIHRSDTVEEKLSLASRFGVAINYNAPTQKEYHAIVKSLAARQGIDMDEKQLLAMANTWEVRHSGFSGRTAQQFVHYLEGQE